MIIQVTRHHILCGCRYSPGSCPIHHAIVDALGARLAGWTAFVAPHSVIFARGEGRQQETVNVSLPDEVAQAIYRFDRIGEMEPFSFELNDAALAPLDRKEATCAH